MNAGPQSPPKDSWKARADERGCYCGLWETSPETYVKLGYPLGFCGVCERCGVPGHTRHFPGPVPYTGAWCDRCYKFLAWTWPFRTVVGWIGILTIAAIVYAIGCPLVAAIGRALG